jgi:hypothetical protein
MNLDLSNIEKFKQFKAKRLYDYLTSFTTIRNCCRFSEEPKNESFIIKISYGCALYIKFSVILNINIDVNKYDFLPLMLQMDIIFTKENCCELCKMNDINIFRTDAHIMEKLHNYIIKVKNCTYYQNIEEKIDDNFNWINFDYLPESSLFLVLFEKYNSEIDYSKSRQYDPLYVGYISYDYSRALQYAKFDLKQYDVCTYKNNCKCKLCDNICNIKWRFYETIIISNKNKLMQFAQTFIDGKNDIIRYYNLNNSIGKAYEHDNVVLQLNYMNGNHILFFGCDSDEL